MVELQSQPRIAAFDPNENGAIRTEPELALMVDLLRAEARRPRIGIRRTREGSGEAALAMLARELSRSRRYRRPLALVGLEAGEGRRAAAHAAAAIRPLVRAVDTVWASATRVFVLLPEADRRDGEGLMERLKEQLNGQLARASADIAVFPVDALTAVALLEIANGGAAAASVDVPIRQEVGLHAVNGSNQPADQSQP